MTGDAPHQIHTYVRRRGRMTRAQARAFDESADDYRVEPGDIAGAGGAPIGIEIGFGMGQALLAWAEASRDWRLVGIELYQPGIGALCDGLSSRELDNVWLVERPAQEVLAELPDACIDEIRIFFPDPWPKKRHLKRRLIQPAFVAALARVLKPGGCARLATDWTPYAEWMRECFAEAAAFACELDETRSAHEASHIEDRARTKFEARGENLGHEIHDLLYVRA